MAISYAALIERAMDARHPVFSTLELTYACNLACLHCYNPVQRKNQGRVAPPPPPSGPPLTFEEIEGLLDQLRDMGVLFLTLTGGEPLLHPRFWDVARAAKERSFALRIFTNGVMIDEEAADRLAHLRPYCLELSLHGASERSSEALTQVPGSFRSQMRALELLKARGIRVYLKCVVTRLVEEELALVKALADRIGYPVYFDAVLVPSDDGDSYPLDLATSDEGIRRLYSAGGLNLGNSPFEREAGQYNCTVGTGVLHVDPYGNVQPCVQWKQAIGNVREKPIAEIWATSPLLEEVRAMSRTLSGKLMETVKDHAYCAHCPALSLLRTGDPTRPDEQYLRVARIRRELAERG